MGIVFHPIAESDLEQIFNFIAEDSPERAIGFVRRIRACCLGLAEFPKRGRPRDDLAKDVRTLVFERRVVIAYRIESQRIVVLRVFYAGQLIDRDRFTD